MSAAHTLLTADHLAEIFAYYPNTRPDDRLSTGAHMQAVREHIEALRNSRAALVAALEYYAATPSSYGQVARAALAAAKGTP